MDHDEKRIHPATGAAASAPVFHGFPVYCRTELGYCILQERGVPDPSSRYAPGGYMCVAEKEMAETIKQALGCASAVNTN
jgi:hypothetical protein